MHSVRCRLRATHEVSQKAPGALKAGPKPALKQAPPSPRGRAYGRRRSGTASAECTAGNPAGACAALRLGSQVGPDLVTSSALKGMLWTPQEARVREASSAPRPGCALGDQSWGEGRWAVPDQPPWGLCSSPPGGALNPPAFSLTPHLLWGWGGSQDDQVSQTLGRPAPPPPPGLCA